MLAWGWGSVVEERSWDNMLPSSGSCRRRFPSDGKQHVANPKYAKGLDYSELLDSSIKKLKEKSDKIGIIIISTL